MQRVLDELAERVRAAAARKQPVCIRGGGSKAFFGNPVSGEALDVTGYHGIVEYEPSELVITVRAGTPLTELEAVLGEHNQMLPFEPPHFSLQATIGGCVAAGLSGPARAYRGAVRDFVLGSRILDGRGEALAFGGKVIKNVAGYDVSRLMVGALGTLGVLTEISFKVLPRPARELSLQFDMTQQGAITQMNRWAGTPLPLSATCFSGDRLSLRLSGSDPGVRAAREKLGGEELPEAEHFWHAVREQTHAAFQAPGALWRLSVPSASAALDLPGKLLVEWGGALRWVVVDAHSDRVRTAAEERGGHATLFRAARKEGPLFQPLAPALRKIHERLKRTFDPLGILNPGRLYDF